MATKPPPPPFVVAHLSRNNFSVLRLKAGQNPGEAPAYVFETSCHGEAAAERVCRGLTMVDEAASS